MEVLDTVFVQRVVLSFLVGAGFVVLVTVAAEKLGSKIGGLVSGLPGSTMIALLFIGLQQGAEFSSQAAAVSPAILGVVVFFFTVYASIEKLLFWPRLLIALSFWFFLSYLIGLSGLTALNQTLPILVFSLLGCYYYLEHVKSIPSAPAIQIEYSVQQLMFRAVAAGLAVAAALVVSKLSGPVWGGIASTFPVATVASLIILQRTAGLDFTRAMLKAAVISAAVNVGSYTVLVSLSYPLLGVGLGTAVSILGAVFTTYASLLFVRRYLK